MHLFTPASAMNGLKNIPNFRGATTPFDSSFILHEETLSLFITLLYFICQIKMFAFFPLSRLIRPQIKLLSV